MFLTFVSTCIRLDHAKIQSDTALTPTEIGLLNATRLPVYKLLNVDVALGHGQTLDIVRYSDIIAINILYQYLQESLDVVRASARGLNWPKGLMQQFFAGVAKARGQIHAQQQSAWEEVAASAQIVAQSQQKERVLAGYLAASLGNQLNWAGNQK